MPVGRFSSMAFLANGCPKSGLIVLNTVDNVLIVSVIIAVVIACTSNIVKPLFWQKMRI